MTKIYLNDGCPNKYTLLVTKEINGENIEADITFYFYYETNKIFTVNTKNALYPVTELESIIYENEICKTLHDFALVIRKIDNKESPDLMALRVLYDAKNDGELYEKLKEKISSSLPDFFHD